MIKMSHYSLHTTASAAIWRLVAFGYWLTQANFESAGGIFRNTESPRTELDRFKLAFLDPTVKGFRVNTCPLSTSSTVSRFRAFQVPGAGCVNYVVISFSPAGFDATFAVSLGRIKRPFLGLIIYTLL
jgi:hypothetical protein